MPHIGWAKLDCLSIICSKILLSGTWKHLHVWSPLPLWPCLLFSPFFNMAWPLTYLCSLVSLLSLTFTLVSCRYWSSFCFSSQPIFCFLSFSLPKMVFLLIITFYHYFLFMTVHSKTPVSPILFLSPSVYYHTTWFYSLYIIFLDTPKLPIYLSLHMRARI